jgi:ParB family chromosome partitioning protein
MEPASSPLRQCEAACPIDGLRIVEAGWTPTVDNYLGRVTKAHILQAVREAEGEQSAQLIEHLKEPDMAREAARLLGGSGWHPEVLRLLADEIPGETIAAPARTRT